MKIDVTVGCFDKKQNRIGYTINLKMTLAFKVLAIEETAGMGKVGF